jgi:hypothetical protein
MLQKVSAVLSLVALFGACCSAVAQQASDPIYSVAQAIQQSSTYNLQRVRVKAHFWWGKEGSMVYDSYYKAVLRLQYSDEYQSNHPTLKYLIDGSRKHCLVIVTGRLKSGEHGKPILVADDLVFLSKPD